jgi:hypothetical protein
MTLKDITDSTLIVRFYGIHCLFHEDTHHLYPIGRLGKIMLPWVLRFHVGMSQFTAAMIPGFETGFPLRVVGKITRIKGITE